jgi:hypothetical protein
MSVIRAFCSPKHRCVGILNRFLPMDLNRSTQPLGFCSDKRGSKYGSLKASEVIWRNQFHRKNERARRKSQPAHRWTVPQPFSSLTDFVHWRFEIRWYLCACAELPGWDGVPTCKGMTAGLDGKVRRADVEKCIFRSRWSSIRYCPGQVSESQCLVVASENLSKRATPT